MADFRLAHEILAAVRQSIDLGESFEAFRQRVRPLLERVSAADRSRRGLTDVERELLEALHDKLAVVRDRMNFALHESTVDHTLPVLQEVRNIYQGAAFLEALMLEPIGSGNA